MTQNEFEGRLALANRLADAARETILPYFRSGRLGTENKGSDGYDPVTIADRAAEQAMRNILETEVPHDGILGDEFGARAGQSGYTWVLDPIDGTRGFLSGTPTWGVLIAVSGENGPGLGIIDQPYTRERFTGIGGVARFERDGIAEEIRVSDKTDLSDAILFSTFPQIGTKAECDGFNQVRDQVKLTRYGTDCYAYALLAAGHIDLVIEAGLNSYDIQAPIAVIEAAGGVVTDWQGGKVHMGGRAIAAATPEIHAAALKLLAPFAGG